MQGIPPVCPHANQLRCSLMQFNRLNADLAVEFVFWKLAQLTRARALQMFNHLSVARASCPLHPARTSQTVSTVCSFFFF